MLSPPDAAHDDFESALAADVQHLCLVSHEGNDEFVLSAFDWHREVTIGICCGSIDNTIVGITLHHICHHHRAEVVLNRTRDAVIGLCHCHLHHRAEEQ